MLSFTRSEISLILRVSKKHMVIKFWFKTIFDVVKLADMYSLASITSPFYLQPFSLSITKSVPLEFHKKINSFLKHSNNLQPERRGEKNKIFWEQKHIYNHIFSEEHHKMTFKMIIKKIVKDDRFVFSFIQTNLQIIG